MSSRFRYSVGPWNVHDGTDMFGGAVRDALDTRETIRRVAPLGFDAIQFHDDDIVPRIDEKSPAEIRRETREMKTFLDDLGLEAEFVAPRLWDPPRFRNGALTNPDPALRRAAVDRSVRCVEMAQAMGCDLVGFWFAREGTVVVENKDPVASVGYLVEALNAVLEADSAIRIFIEPKPNEPIDRSFAPTMGHAIALSSLTVAPERVGGLVESAHAVLAGLDPALEMAFAVAAGRLFGVHLNDQNSLRYDQDKVFGAENLRQAFNQIRVLVDNDFGSRGEYVGLDVKALGPQPASNRLQHLKNSLRVISIMEEKVRLFADRRAAVGSLDIEEEELLVLETILGVDG
ncbi:MAG: TIM barrel protein [Alkalispirochaeta sp.]